MLTFDFNMVKLFRQYIEQIKFWCVCVPCQTQEWRKRILFTRLSESVWQRNIFDDNFDENYPKKLQCQIVRFIMLVPNYPGANLSVFTMLVPNCSFHYLGAKFSFCLLVAKISVFTILESRCQIVLPPKWLQRTALFRINFEFRPWKLLNSVGVWKRRPTDDIDDGCKFTCFFRASNSLGRGEAGIEV